MRRKESIMCIRTVSSWDFAHDLSAAKRAAAEGGTVFITDRGEPAFALLNIDEYRRIAGVPIKNMVDLLAVPEVDDLDLDFERVLIAARELES